MILFEDKIDDLIEELGELNFPEDELGKYDSLKDPFEAIDDKDEDLRINAIKILLKMNDLGIAKPLFSLLGDPKNFFAKKYKPGEFLEKIKDSNKVEALIIALRNEDDYVRRWAAIMLGKINDVCSVEPLILALNDEDELVRKEALSALVKLKDLRAVEPIIDRLAKENYSYLKADLVDALARIGGDKAVKHIVSLLNDKDIMIKRSAISAFGYIWDLGVESLFTVLKGRNRINRLLAVEIISQKANSSAVLPLISALKDTNVKVSEKAAEGLIRIGNSAVESLIPKLKDENEYVRGKTAKILGEIRDSRVVEPLISTLKDNSVLVRGLVIVALGKIGDARAKQPLINLLKDNNELIRKRAKDALRKINNEQEGISKQLEYFIYFFVIFSVLYGIFAFLLDRPALLKAEAEWKMYFGSPVSVFGTQDYYLAKAISFVIASTITKVIQASYISKGLLYFRALIFAAIFWLIDSIILTRQSSFWDFYPTREHAFTAPILSVICTIFIIRRISVRKVCPQSSKKVGT